MKKLLLFIVALALCLPCITALAEYEFSIEPLESNAEPLISKSDPPGLMEVNGVKYIFNDNIRVSKNLNKYDERTYNFFKKVDDYIWTGEYYYARKTDHDLAPSKVCYIAAETDPEAHCVRLYDSNFNLVKKYRFNEHVYRIYYYSGSYYCYLRSGKYMVSTDLENWTETLEPIPRQVGNVVYKFGEENMLSIAGSDFFPVLYESWGEPLPGNQFGEWTLHAEYDETQRKRPLKSISFSNDHIYFVKVKCENGTEYPDVNAMALKTFYEYEDDLVIDCESFRLRTPKQPIYDELERMKNAPYVKVNNKLLAFETPPVTENDRMLVPMRFLFETMGANVDWNNDTQTATVREKGKEIAFSINSTEANVSGNKKTMDVPARLINDKTMVPLRFLSEGLGYTVQWDEERHIASISKPEDVTAMRFWSEKTSDKFWF